MKNSVITLLPLALAALLLSGCADTAVGNTTDAGDRPRPTPAATTKAESEPDPPAVAEIVWAKHSDDPWANWSDTESPEIGKLYYQLNPSLAEGQTTDENTRYVMSFTYVTADYHRYDLKEYMHSRNFQRYEYREDEDESYYALFVLTEAEIKSITPESVQAYYGLDSAPAVVGIHRDSSSTRLSESAWYRADLLWGEMIVYDVLTYPSGVVKLADPLDKANFKNDHRPLAIWCEVRTDSDKSCKDYFASLGWEIMEDEYCWDSSNHTVQMSDDHVLVAATLDQLLEVDLAEIADYYGCDESDIGVVFVHAMPQSIASFEAITQ